PAQAALLAYRRACVAVGMVRAACSRLGEGGRAGLMAPTAELRRIGERKSAIAVRTEPIPGKGPTKPVPATLAASRDPVDAGRRRDRAWRRSRPRRSRGAPGPGRGPATGAG